MFLDRVVIGSSLESIVYAIFNDAYFIPTLSFGPVFYRKLESRILPSHREDYTWSRFQIMLSLSGKLLNYEDLYKIKVLENIIKISSRSGTCRYEFGMCEIFDTTMVEMENSITHHKPSEYIVYDDFEVSVLGGKHTELESKKSEDTLAKEIHFYSSDRVDGSRYITDCVAESHLSKEQLNDIDYSDSMVRFSVIRHLQSIGVEGSFMGNYKNGKSKYRKPKVKHKKRIVVERERNIYRDTKSVKILNLSLAEVLK